MLAVIVEFPLFGPLGKTATVVFVRIPLDIRQYLRQYLTTEFFYLFHRNHIKASNKFVLNLFAPWQETFADAGDGDGGGEPFRIHFKIILTPFEIHFKTILGPPMPTNYVLQPKINKCLLQK